MPSVGGLENTRNEDANLEQTSRVISEEISGQNPTSKSKSTSCAAAQQGELDRPKLTMAPNKNGEVQGQDKPNSPQKQTNGDLTSSKDITGNEALNGTEASQSEDGLSSNDKSDSAIEGKDADEDSKKTATEKRAEYKDRPRASSVEVLGLSKKWAKIKYQDVLAPELEEAFDTGLKRRHSSPAKIRAPSGDHCAAGQQATKSGDVEGLTSQLGKVQLTGSKEPGFAERMEGEQQPNELTSKGPEKKGSVLPARPAPYQTGQPCMQYHQTMGYQGMTYQMGQPPAQQYVWGSASQVYQNPSVQQYPTGQQVKVVCPPGKKLAVPGMRQMNPIPYTRLNDGRVIGNLPAQPSSNAQMLSTQPQGTHVRSDSGRVPCETTYDWPTSPTNVYPCDPNSPLSQASMSPDHMMQSEPSPGVYSPGHPPSASMMHSPQSVQSPSDSNAMSTSPSSPDSPEYITLNSPHSVRSVESADSGIASPPHVNQYISSSGLNSGSVIENQPRLFDDPDKEREINRIVETLKSGFEGPDIANANTLPPQQRQPPRRQPHIPQQRNPPQIMPAVQTMPAGMLPGRQPLSQIQPQYDNRNLVQPQVQILAQAHLQMQNMENLVNNMSLDLLCSQDEDEDTALHIAISQGEPSLCSTIIKRLVQSGRPDALNIRDKLGQTPVYVAVVTNQPNLVYELLQNGADIMIPNKEGTTPLHYASAKGYARALQAIGCSLFNSSVTNWNINVENRHGMSPLQCAVQAHGRYEQIYDGHECCYVNKLVDSTDTVKNLLALGADPAFQDRRSGYTALHYAVELAPNEKVATNAHIIKLILQVSQNAMELLRVSSYAGNTPLHVIAGRDYSEDYVVGIIDLLISYGAEIQVKNAENHAPHDLVSKEKNKRVYSRLQGDHLQGK